MSLRFVENVTLVRELQPLNAYDPMNWMSLLIITSVALVQPSYHFELMEWSEFVGALIVASHFPASSCGSTLLLTDPDNILPDVV